MRQFSLLGFRMTHRGDVEAVVQTADNGFLTVCHPSLVPGLHQWTAMSMVDDDLNRRNMVWGFNQEGARNMAYTCYGYSGPVKKSWHNDEKGEF